MEAQVKDEWPRKPPKVDNQKKLGKDLLQLRLAARAAALGTVPPWDWPPRVA